MSTKLAKLMLGFDASLTAVVPEISGFPSGDLDLLFLYVTLMITLRSTQVWLPSPLCKDEKFFQYRLV